MPGDKIVVLGQDQGLCQRLSLGLDLGRLQGRCL